jgi:serine phosphatase RsbU (regulator of sigma subunit)
MRVASIRRGLRRLRPRRKRPTERVALAVSLGVLVVGTAWSILDNNNQVKIAAVTTIVIVLASLVVTMRSLIILSGVVVVCLTTVFTVHGISADQLSLSGLVMIATALLVAMVQAHRRDRLGLKQMSAEQVIGLIRDRLLVQARLPELPHGWTIEIGQQPADGAAIAGDFVSSRLIRDEHQQILHIAVIDVSGSGIAAGPRALLLSGAVGGLLGAVEPDDFLAAANDYLVRQRWSLGFASAIYARLDLRTGEYGIRVAGHPPAFHFRPTAASPWRTSPATGTVLGVLPNLTGVADAEALAPGEALVLYTDGVVEDRTRDLDAGTLRLRETVEVLASQDSWDGLADHLIERVPAKVDDDRTVVVIRRLPVPVQADGTDIEAIPSPDRSLTHHS